METIVFLKGLSVAFIMVLLLGGLVFWIIYGLVKFRKKTKYWFKYKFLKRKHNPQDVAMLMEFLDQGLTSVEVKKDLLINGKAGNKRIEELMYVYREMQGGKKK